MRPGSVMIIVGDAAWTTAERRLAAARARSAAADALVLIASDPAAATPVHEMPDVEACDSPPAPLRAIGAWLLSWPFDAASRIKLRIARSVFRARERPAARARDGPP